jgi:hypothetical protein
MRCLRLKPKKNAPRLQAVALAGVSSDGATSGGGPRDTDVVVHTTLISLWRNQGKPAVRRGIPLSETYNALVQFQIDHSGRILQRGAVRAWEGMSPPDSTAEDAIRRSMEVIARIVADEALKDPQPTLKK